MKRLIASDFDDMSIQTGTISKRTKKHLAMQGVFYLLYLRKSVTVHKGIKLISTFAHRTFRWGIALIIRQILGIENRVDGEAAALVNRCEDGRDTNRLATVIFNSINSFFSNNVFYKQTFK